MSFVAGMHIREERIHQFDRCYVELYHVIAYDQ